MIIGIYSKITFFEIKNEKKDFDLKYLFILLYGIMNKSYLLFQLYIRKQI